MRSTARQPSAFVDRMIARLNEPTNVQSLAVFRIAFGLIMAWDVWRFIRADRTFRYYAAPEFTFSYYGFSWIKPLPEPFIHYAWLLVGLFALLVAAGLFYRVAIIGFTLLFSYFFLLDKAQYLNHFYMVILFAGLLCFAPANRALSLDAIFFPRRKAGTAPFHWVWALRAQMEIILLYAGLVKISEDWLRLEPLGMWLRPQANDVPLGALLYNDWVIALGAYGAIALHLVGAPLLLMRRTRFPVFVVYVCFHLANAYFFNIGVFPWLTIAATTIFFEPDWPQRLARRFLARGGAAPAPAPSTARPLSRQSRATAGALVVWMIIQALIPLRFALYSGEVRWTGEGHRFAWRMRLYDREGRGHFEVVDTRTRQIWPVAPADFLTERQASVMLTRPDMILQFAHHLEAVWVGMGFNREAVAVYAHIEMSLNGRKPQPLIKPDVDLTTRIWRPWRSADFITDLTTPFALRDERMRQAEGPRS